MTDTKLESLRDWIVTTLAEIEEMGVDDPPDEGVVIVTPEQYIQRTPQRRAANGRFIKNEK